jgi:hypothetical protein
MRFRIQVDLGPQRRIAIFRPDENHLPDEQKTYFSEVKFGVMADHADNALLEPEEIVFDGQHLGVDLTRFRQRTGRTDTPNFAMPADLFRQLLQDLKEKKEE